MFVEKVCARWRSVGGFDDLFSSADIIFRRLFSFKLNLFCRQISFVSAEIFRSAFDDIGKNKID